MSRPVGGVLSSLRGGLGDHPSTRPTWGLQPPERLRAGRPCPTLGLAPGGVYRAVPVARAAGALLPHRFNLACAGRGPPSAVCFLWHSPAGRPDWPLASTLPCGAPTFLDPAPCRERHDPGRGHPAGSPSHPLCQECPPPVARRPNPPGGTPSGPTRRHTTEPPPAARHRAPPGGTPPSPDLGHEPDGPRPDHPGRRCRTPSVGCGA